MNLKSSFVSHLNKKYPELSTEQLNPLISDLLISTHQIQLSSQVLQSIQNEIKSYWKLRHWGVEHLTPSYEVYGLRKPTNYAACMSYDFHLNSNNELELIEINTNAAFLALGLEMYSFFNLPHASPDFSEKSIPDMFQSEISLTDLKNTNPTFYILDENPAEQRLYAEFLVYQALLKKYGQSVEVLNLLDLNQTGPLKTPAFIYNRYTDFYLQEKKSQQLKTLFNAKKIELSPNPYEYFLLADKQRFLDWNTQTALPRPSSLLPVYDLGREDKDKIWSERKNLFFKPKTSFGSKQAYKGASVSRKIFDEMMTPNFIAQKISPPPEIDITINGEVKKMKYDLRCYAYQDQLQLVVARLYQGQTTNLRTEGGGFACCVFN